MGVRTASQSQTSRVTGKTPGRSEPAPDGEPLESEALQDEPPQARRRLRHHHHGEHAEDDEAVRIPDPMESPAT